MLSDRTPPFSVWRPSGRVSVPLRGLGALRPDRVDEFPFHQWIVSVPLRGLGALRLLYSWSARCWARLVSVPLRGLDALRRPFVEPLYVGVLNPFLRSLPPLCRGYARTRFVHPKTMSFFDLCGKISPIDLKSPAILIMSLRGAFFATKQSPRDWGRLLRPVKNVRGSQ